MSNGLWVPDFQSAPGLMTWGQDTQPSGPVAVESSSQPRGPLCRTFWGSHGCSLPRGHEGLHTCGAADDEDDPAEEEGDGLCGQHRNTETGGETRWWTYPDDEDQPEHWGDWMESYPSFGEDSGSS